MSGTGEWPSAEALERAAKAARELEGNKNAKAMIELGKREQDVKKAEEARKQAEAGAQAAQFAVEQERTRWEEQRKTIEFNAKQQTQTEQTKHELARKRMEEEHQKARLRNEELVDAQMKQQARLEQLRAATEAKVQEERRKTDEYRARLERENMVARAEADARGRALELRENEEIHARQLRIKGEERRKGTKEAIDATFSNLSATLGGFFADKGKIMTGVATVTMVAAGVYVTREAARVAGQLIQARLGTPSLVRETSRTTGHFALKKRLARLFSTEKDGFKGVVLKPDHEERVRRLGVATRNTRANAAPFRNMLFYGPPGTGKTLVATKLAKSAGLEYAIMSGGDVGPLGRHAVTELHKLFDWSATSGRGVLLFIDEADAFLSSRSRSTMSEDQRNALNALLYRTGTVSKRFMVVLATNRPGDLDSAITDRIDETMHFDLPDIKSREAMLQLYFDKYITESGKDADANPLSRLVGFRTAHIKTSPKIVRETFFDIARRTDGFSGRSIEKLMISVQAHVYGGEAPELTPEMLESIVSLKVREHQDKARLVDFNAA